MLANPFCCLTLQGQFFNLLIAKYFKSRLFKFFAFIPTRITKRSLKMQIQAESQTHSLKPIPNPRGTQTVPQPKPTLRARPTAASRRSSAPTPRRPNRRSNALGANDSRQETAKDTTSVIYHLEGRRTCAKRTWYYPPDAATAKIGAGENDQVNQNYRVSRLL